MQKSFTELYDVLADGGSFSMEFESLEAADYFRRRFATYKYRAERELIGLGVFFPRKLSMQYKDGIATFSLVDKSPQTTFKVLSITKSGGA